MELNTGMALGVEYFQDSGIGKCEGKETFFFFFFFFGNIRVYYRICFTFSSWFCFLLYFILLTLLSCFSIRPLKFFDKT